MSIARELEAVATPYAGRLAAAGPVSDCGGKAFHLRRMRELDLPVPEGLVVGDRAFQEFLDENDLREPIARLLNETNFLNPEVLAGTARAIRGLIEHARVPKPVVTAIARLLPELRRDARLAVRSSAVGEDSLQAAFAGQLDTVLHVENAIEPVCRALRDCWASYWSPRVLFYQHTRNVALCGMGVVIQEQVASDLSGVLFTRHPGAAQDLQWADWMLAEYCHGLGDALVSGAMTPGSIVISRADSTWRMVAAPEVGPAGGNHSADVTAVAINDELVARLAQAARTLEAAFGGPQDIEWTVARDGQLFLLQSRPITVPTGPAVLPRSAVSDTTPGAAKTERKEIWSNANINENYPDPVSPLLYSIASAGYYHYFRNLGVALGVSQRRLAAMEYPLRNIVGVHGARLYYNLTNIHAVLRIAPLGDFLTESFNLFVGADQTSGGDAKLTWRGLSTGRIAQCCEAARIGVQSLWQFLWLSRRVAVFERTVDEFAAATRPDALSERSLAQLLGDLRGFVEIRNHRWRNASLADAASMLSYGLLKTVLSREFPAEDAGALHNSLLRGLRDVVSGTPAALLWKLSRRIRDSAELRTLFAGASGADIYRALQIGPEHASFLQEFHEFLEQWGFRCSGELMLTVPGFQERPEALIEILKGLAEVDGESPETRLERQAEERTRETRSVLKELSRRRYRWYLPWPRRSFLVARLLRWTQRSIVCRERARLKQSLLYSRCRRIALAIGTQLVSAGILGEPDDVFFLTVQELEALLSGGSMFAETTRELVDLRRRAHAEVSRRIPPDTFSLAAGPSTTSAWQEMSPRENCDNGEVAGEDTILRGVAACGGRATAPAAVLENVTEAGRLSRGDILVARQTDPGWAPVFLLIRGLVIERGGMLSHGAILAREYGLPTVVGVPHATQRIRSGQTITVNGDRGLVELADV